MEKTGSNKLFDNLFEAAYTLDLGRKNFHLEGKEAAGRILFAAGIENALKTFQEINTTKDSQIIISAEKIYLQQDKQFCDPSDKLTMKNLDRSMQYLDDALRSIETVKSAANYKSAETTHATEHREKRG